MDAIDDSSTHGQVVARTATSRGRLIAALLVVGMIVAACGTRLDDETLAAIDEATFATGGSGGGSARGPVSVGSSNGAATDSGVNGTSGGTGATGGSGQPSTGGGTGTAAGPSDGGDTPADDGGEQPGEAPPAEEACTPVATGPGVTESEIVVAAMVTDSGPLPGATAGNFRGAAALAEKINAEGGICGRRIRVLKGDDGLDPARARAEFTRLEPQVVAFVGSLSVADSGYIDLIEQTGVPYVGTAVDPSGRGLPSVWPKGRTDLVNTGPFDWAAQTFPDAKRVGYLLTAVEGVRVNSPGQEAALENAGYTFAYGPAELGPADPDYTAHVIQMRQAQVDFVYAWSLEINMQARLTRNMRQQNFQPPVKMGNLIYNDKFVELVGDQADGWSAHLAHLPVLNPDEPAKSPVVASFVEWNRRVFPSDQLDLFPVFGWRDMDYFADVLRKLGADVTRDSLNEGLGSIEETDDGLYAPLNPVSGVSSTCFAMVQVKDGKWVRQHPAEGLECNIGQNLDYR